MNFIKNRISTLTSYHDDIVFQQYLDIIYQSINEKLGVSKLYKNLISTLPHETSVRPKKNTFSTTNRSIQAKPHKNSVAETYGEVLYPSIHKLLSELAFTQQDIFYDLGSGIGKVVLHVYLQTSVKEAYGIELLPGLHERATLAAQQVEHDFQNYVPGKKLEFLLGDFLEIDFQKATIVFINSICFGQDLLLKLGHIINYAPGIHTVITLRPIDNLQKVSFKKTIHLESSWGSGLCYIYQK